jgi:hypothetical protein
MNRAEAAAVLSCSVACRYPRTTPTAVRMNIPTTPGRTTAPSFPVPLGGSTISGSGESLWRRGLTASGCPVVREVGSDRGDAVPGLAVSLRLSGEVPDVGAAGACAAASRVGRGAPLGRPDPTRSIRAAFAAARSSRVAARMPATPWRGVSASSAGPALVAGRAPVPVSGPLGGDCTRESGPAVEMDAGGGLGPRGSTGVIGVREWDASTRPAFVGLSSVGDTAGPGWASPSGSELVAGPA